MFKVVSDLLLQPVIRPEAHWKLPLWNAIESNSKIDLAKLECPASNTGSTFISLDEDAAYLHIAAEKHYAYQLSLLLYCCVRREHAFFSRTPRTVCITPTLCDTNILSYVNTHVYANAE
jgi:hypothetical protein